LSPFAEAFIGSKNRYIVGCIYRHPSLPMEEFNTYTLLLSYIGLILKVSLLLSYIGLILKVSQFFLIGDFNCDLLKSETNHEVSDFLDIIGSNSLCPQISLRTRLSNTSKTLLTTYSVHHFLVSRSLLAISYQESTSIFIAWES